MNFWREAQAWELEWWNNCTNTFGEETKQFLYADRIGLVQTPSSSTPFRFDMDGKSILDIGGGPVSLLLKCVNVRGKVIDSLKFPEWVIERYKAAGIRYQQIQAEELDLAEEYDEAWVYNLLQHSEDPRKIIENAKKVAKIIRIFEWIDIPVNIGHPQTLTEEKLNLWLGGEGKVEELKNQNQCSGRAYFGVFKGKRYER